MRVDVHREIGLTSGFSKEDADKFNAFFWKVQDAQHLVFDFKGVKNFTSHFFNETMAKYLVEVGFVRYQNQIDLVNLTPVGKGAYLASFDNAINFIAKKQNSSESD